jgi:hypothetical protein
MPGSKSIVNDALRFDGGGGHMPCALCHSRKGLARSLEGARELIDCNRSGAVDDAGPAQRPDASAGGAELLRTGHDFYGQVKVLSVSRSNEHNRIV